MIAIWMWTEGAASFLRMYVVALLAAGVIWPFLRFAGLGASSSWLAARAVGPTALALAYFHFVRFSGFSPGAFVFWLVASLVGTASVVLARRLERPRRREWRFLRRFESTFAAGAFALIFLFGRHYGNVALGERALDLGLLSSLWCTSALPAVDFWFASERLHTYLLGQWTFATIAHAAGAEPFRAYFFGVVHVWLQAFAACLFAARAFGARRADTALVAASVLLLGNAAVPYRWVVVNEPFSADSQLLAARLIAFTITENPGIAFWVAELHAHVMVIPLLASWVAIAARALERGSLRLAVVLGVLSAMVAMTDAWMIPPAAVCGVALLAASLPLSPSFLARAVPLAIGVALAAAAPWLVDYAGFPVVFRFLSESTTRVSHLVILFGPLWFLLTLARLSGTPRPLRSRRAGALLLTGLLLILACETIYVENWHPHPYERQNTIFRFHFAAWIFMALSLGGLWCRGRGRCVLRSAAWATIALFAALNVAPAACSLSQARFQWDLRRALDPLREGRLAAADWLSRNTACETVIAESAGVAGEGVATVSAMAGRPTVLGDREKVFQRGISAERIDERLSDLAAIYCDERRSMEVLRRFRVRYIVVGPAEKRAFPGCDPSALLRRYPPAFQSGETTLLDTTTLR